MASNATQYKDLTPAAKLDKATLNKMVWLSCQLQASFNYERMQACGWLWSMLPGLQKIHTNKEDLAASMTHNMEFFNTHPFFVTFVMGIVLSLEQQKADIATIRSVRVAAMGPLGGIGAVSYTHLRVLLDTRYDEMLKVVDAFDFKRIVYLGSNVLKGTAQESALKMLELTAGKVVTMYEMCIRDRLYTCGNP